MFDLLYFNGESLVKRPFIERRKLLKENFVEVEEQFLLATSLDTTTMEEVQDFLEESIKGKSIFRELITFIGIIVLPIKTKLY